MLTQGIKNDIKKLAVYVLVMTVIMVGVFAACGYFDTGVVLGAALGYAAAMANFILLAVTLSKSLGKAEHATRTMGLSYVLRMFLIAAVVLTAIKLPLFNYVAAVLPLVFPRFAIMIMNLRKKKVQPQNDRA